MKTLTTVEEIKAEAARDNNATFFVELNKPVVEWLKSIGGKNRNLKYINVDMWVRRLMNNTWRSESCDMKITSSCNWLIDGHHRIEAIAHCGIYNKIARLSVIRDENAEIVFTDQDCVGARRTTAEVATLQGLENATAWLSVEKYYRLYVFGDHILSSVESGMAFAKSHQWVKDEKILITDICSNRRMRGCAVAAFVYAVDHRPDRAEEIKQFLHTVLDGEMLTRTSPAFWLRNALISRLYNNKMEFLAVLKAISLHLAGRSCGCFRVSEKEYDTITNEWGVTSKYAPRRDSDRPTSFRRRVAYGISQQKGN
jgi:hypothetical protein